MDALTPGTQAEYFCSSKLEETLKVVLSLENPMKDILIFRGVWNLDTKDISERMEIKEDKVVTHLEKAVKLLKVKSSYNWL